MLGSVPHTLQPLLFAAPTIGPRASGSGGRLGLGPPSARHPDGQRVNRRRRAGPDQPTNFTLQRMPAGIRLSGLASCRRTPKVPLAASIKRSTTVTLALYVPDK